MDKIYHFKLANQDELIGRLYEDKEGSYMIEYPMSIGERVNEGNAQVVLHKYMQFSMNNFVEIEKEKVICIAKVNEEFCRYYDNSIIFNTLYIDKNIHESLVQTNLAIEGILKSSDHRFDDIMKKYKLDINDFDMTTVN